MMEGRFTLRGSAAVEALIAGIVRQAAGVIGGHVRPDELRALALIGGYGRGEGGVDRSGGSERPHNNLDFLLVTDRTIRPGLKELLDRSLEPLRQQHAVGLDLGIVTARALRRAPCLVMWYDMRYGHKTVLGDASFLPSLTHFSQDAIVPGDVRDLLVNRGTLLIINEALLEQGGADDARRRALVRHAAKAIIGYGDTLLFFRGRYHWSYVEKRRRVAELRDVSAGFRQLYEEASAFRFEPDYDALGGRDLVSWLEEVRRQLSEVHLACEAIRMATPGLQWDGYFERGLRSALMDGGLRARVWLRKVRNAVRFRSSRLQRLGWREQLGLQLGGNRGLLATMFPCVAYGVGGERDRELTRHALSAGGSASELRRAYLRYWGASSDPNFMLVARRLGLDLEARGR
ncbi:hypothetical protein [Hyalangium gracile]|uniref:hypothetical protein n=1 Tax=Hyalangium gracile TaxID=394092 RepID=UPI001CC9A809|nr:hypothetical protein [Hyalangium gracile]